MTATELRRRAADLREKILATVNVAEGENRELTAEESAQCDEWRTEAEGLDRRVKVIESAEAAVSQTRQLQPRVSAPIAGGVETDRIDSVRGGAEGDKTRFFGDFLRTLVLMKDSNIPHDQREAAQNRVANLYGSQYRAWDSPSATREKRTLSATTGSAGGHTIPPDFYRGVMQVVGENSIVRPRATVLPMAGLSIPIPLLNQSAAPPTGGSAFFGGLNLQWTGETESKPDTEPAFKQATLEAHELSGTTKVSRVLLMKSAISIDALLFTLFGRAVAWMEDLAFLLGVGPSRPKGVIPSGATVTTADRGSATVISFANIADVFVRAIASSQGTGVFLASQAAQPAVLKATGTSGSVFIPAGLVPVSADGQKAAGVNLGAFARPILFSEKLPALDSLGDFGFYDFSQYVVGDPDMAMEIATSEHVSFQNNQIMFRLIHYVGGMPWLDAPITLADGATTVSPFVALGVH